MSKLSGQHVFIFCNILGPVAKWIIEHVTVPILPSMYRESLNVLFFFLFFLINIIFNLTKTK